MVICDILVQWHYQGVMRLQEGKLHLVVPQAKVKKIFLGKWVHVREEERHDTAKQINRLSEEVFLMMEVFSVVSNSHQSYIRASQVVLMVKNPPANAGAVGLIPMSGISPGEGNGNPFQYSCLENAKRSLVDYSPWDHKELDMTEQLSTRTQPCIQIAG